MAVLEDAKVWEGTWEEIAAHAEEFKGRRVQLMVFNGANGVANGTANGVADAVQNEEEPQMLDTWLEGYIGVVEFEPTDVAARSKELWGEYVEEKHRRIKKQRRKP